MGHILNSGVDLNFKAMLEESSTTVSLQESLEEEKIDANRQLR